MNLTTEQLNIWSRNSTERRKWSTIIAGDFKTALSVTKRLSRERILKDEEDTNSSKNNFTSLICIENSPPPHQHHEKKIHILPKYLWNIHQDAPRQTTSWVTKQMNKFKRMEVMWIISLTTMELHWKSITRRYQESLQVNLKMKHDTFK